MAVRELGYRFVDTSRPTPCLGTAERVLDVTVCLPDGDGPLPVVVVGPGSGAAQRAVARADAGALARRGYVGVALPFPSTNAPGHHTRDPEVALDVYRQPADVSFVLDRLLEESARPAGELSGRLDSDRVGYTGTSSGGVTGLLFFNETCADPRIRAVVATKAFAVPTGAGLPVEGAYDWARPIASYLWAACHDAVIPFAAAYEAFLAAPAPKFFVQCADGDHDAPVAFPGSSFDAFLACYVAGRGAPEAFDALLAAADDPHVAYDLGPAGGRLAIPPCRPGDVA